MAINRIEIDTDALNHDTGLIAENLNVLQNNMKAMYEEVRELDAMWDGKANQAFNIQFGKDCNTMLEILNSLKQYIQSLETAKEAYDRCEGSVNDIVRSLNI